MARINEWDAESAIQEVAERLPEESEELIGEMVVCNATAPDAWIEKHSEWREEGGVPHFRAIIRYTNEAGWPLIGGDYIHVEVTGTFKESRNGLTVETWAVEDCHLFDPSERYVKPF